MAGSCDDAQVKVVFQKNNCLLCHNATIFQGNGGGLNLETGDVGARLVDAPTQFGGTACQNELLIDALTPQNSLILKLTDKDRLATLSASGCKRQPMPQTAVYMSGSDYACLASWVNKVAASKTPPPPLPNDPFAFAPANAGSALAKAKYLLHGGAPTSAELQSVGGSQADLDFVALRNTIISWESTPEYEIKVKDFLALALQQLPEGNFRYQAQLGDIYRAGRKIDYNLMSGNIADSFVRTAWINVKDKDDFRKVITTRDWYVTTAMLAVLVYLEKPNQTAGRGYSQGTADGDLFSDLAYLQPSDYTDWRKVTLIQSDVPAVWENSASFTAKLRAVGEGGQLALRYPRVGFFSSPVFLNTWETNDDNQFRLTTNQTLIVALNKNLSPSDATANITENGIPPDHASKTSVCYQCHRHMDPMRLAFNNVMSTNYRAKNPDTSPETRPSFSFYGVVKNFNTMDEFATILSQHPEMPKGWVQKLCVWGNSTQCDETDLEFVRLVNFFKGNGYSLQKLIRQFFSSPIFTGTSQTKSHETNEFIVSMSRGNHFCRAFDARVEQIHKAIGTTRVLPLCNDGALGLVATDDYTRGQVELVQPTRLGWVDSKSIDGECARVAYSATAPGTDTLFNLDSPVADTLGYMTEFLIGIPKNHHRYAPVLAGLTRTYDMTTKPSNCSDPTTQQGAVTCGYGLTKRDGLRAAFFAACTSPELVGIGI